MRGGKGGVWDSGTLLYVYIYFTRARRPLSYPLRTDFAAAVILSFFEILGIIDDAIKQVLSA